MEAVEGLPEFDSSHATYNSKYYGFTELVPLVSNVALLVFNAFV